MRPAAASTTVDVPETRWARTVDGACIAYQDIGEGPVTLVVVHGWVSHLEIYWEQPRYVRFLRRLSRNLRVLVFDKRGIGMSDRVAGSPDLGVLLDDVRAVMDAAGVEKAALLGWGGPGPELAAFFAATYPSVPCALHSQATSTIERSLTTPGRDRKTIRGDLAGDPPGWGTVAGSHRVRAQRILERPGPADTRPPTTTRSSCAGTRSWPATRRRRRATRRSSACGSATDVRPVLATDLRADRRVLSSRGRSAMTRARREQAGLIPGARAVPVATTSEVIWVPDPEPIVAAIEQFIASVRARGGRARPHARDGPLHRHRRLDRQGLCALGDAGWTDLLEKHNATVRAFLARYRGNEIKTTGDGFLATFDGPARAVKCAQGDLRGGEAPGHRGARRLPHRRDRAAGRRRRRHRRAHRRPGRRPRRALRGPRHVDRQGPRRRLRPRVRGPRRAPAQGRAGRVASLRARTDGRVRSGRGQITGGGHESRPTPDPRREAASPSRRCIAPANWRRSSARRCSRRCRERHRKQVAELADRQALRATATVIVREGEPGDSFHVVLEGDALVTPSDGRERLPRCRATTSASSRCIDGRASRATVTAVGAVTTGRVSRTDFQHAPARGAGPGRRPPPRRGARRPRPAADGRRGTPRPRAGWASGGRARRDAVEAAGKDLEGSDALGWLHGPAPRRRCSRLCPSATFIASPSTCTVERYAPAATTWCRRRTGRRPARHPQRPRARAHARRPHARARRRRLLRRAGAHRRRCRGRPR